jgi:exodeoxyribonuclease VII large subunit
LLARAGAALYHEPMDLPNEEGAVEQAAHNIPEFTVGQISSALQRTVETAFARVRVRGEVSGFKRAASGHLYFALKDEDAVLDAMCWRAAAGRLSVKPEDGMEVVVTGRLTTYPGRSKYQIIVESVALAGKGALLALIEERKKRLAAEGLFDAARKKPLPWLPEVIGIVTSPTGAVIRDILHRLADRFPRHVLVWPVPVQGEQAATQIAAAIAGFCSLPAFGLPRPDLLIVARGGGSIEDLMAFNEEAVVRAAASCTIPLISAVGHETDTTLIDFAADKRAPTPTAAAEMAVPVRAELRRRVQEGGARLIGGLERFTEQRVLTLAGLARGLGDPRHLVQQQSQRLDDKGDQLDRAVRRLVEDRRVRVAAARVPDPAAQLRLHRQHLLACGARLEAGMSRERHLAEETLKHSRARFSQIDARLEFWRLQFTERPRQRLESLARLLESYAQEPLERGYALVRDAAGEPVTSAAAAEPGQPLSVTFKDGTVGVTVDGERAKPVRPKEIREAKAPAKQGNLW